VFPDDASVNDALRSLLKVAQQSIGLKFPLAADGPDHWPITIRQA
jgi:hypothetical protein